VLNLAVFAAIAVIYNISKSYSVAVLRSTSQEKKIGDWINDAILRGYESLIENYYPTDSIVLSMFKCRMMYAGPREAVFDSIVRENYGCTHFIIGRNHAGVGDYYGDFEAQQLFDAIGNIGIEPLYFHYAFYCKRCDGIVSEKICPYDSTYHMDPSGTELRKMLSEGEQPPPELTHPEVAETVLNIDNLFVGEQQRLHSGSWVDRLPGNPHSQVALRID
jgi:sulfate adenylyltransferase